MTTAFKIVGSDRVAEHENAPRAWRVYDDAADVAQSLRPDAPVFCYSAESLRARVRSFLDGFPGEVSYAVKANSGPDVILAMAGAGMTVFDVASVEEMALVRSLVPRAAFHYHNPVKSRLEIATAHSVYGCRRFAADDAQEIAKIAAVVENTDGIEVAVRFRLTASGASAHDFSSKFGATPEEAVELMRQAVQLGFAPVLTFHPGSQCLEPRAFARHIQEAASIARQAGVAVTALNVGGGFPARYLAGPVPPLEDYFHVIGAAAEEAFPEKVPALECEPGRGLVAPAFSLLTRVKLVRPRRREVFINDGIYGALMEVSQAPVLMPLFRVLRDGRTLGCDAAGFTVYGPTCDPMDRLPAQLLLPADIAEDDFIEFGAMGAYGAATATRFNGYEIKDTVPVRQAYAG